ncbi:Protein GAMETE EXPRESSED 1 [Dichanthelium oligosanthes]|uniref:Protein GAMETE EXPRESSED 1 n=1 Tax=Dichanthelium oligosanthes TaxID=888268 RepID=A0A1E5WHP3_9POAL|nr:Protein GAMETE EXPRESSED 1 [Dichanthelium oligosanthes]
MTRNTCSVLLILICLWVCPPRISGFSWNIFSSSTGSSGTANQRAPMMELEGAVADFAMDGANDPRGLKLLENARSKLAGPRNCWQEAYRKLFASCGDIMADKEMQSRLAWHLSSCFQEDSGRPPFPSCSEGSKMVHCRKRLSEFEAKVFLEFFLETNTLCHQLQAEAFKHNTERLVNDLTRTSKSAEEKLEVIEERSEQIIKESGKVKDTLSSIEVQTDHLAETSKNVGEKINDVLAHSKAVYEQSKEIAAAQAALKEGQTEMREKIDAGMVRVEESYESLGNGMDKLKEETGYIQREIKSVGDSMSSKMQDLQSKADDIGSVAGKSLENQMHLLDGQNRAMEGLNTLHSFQEKALEESRETVQKLAQFGQRQQEELLARQEQIRQAHDHLIQNSHSILEAQVNAHFADMFASSGLCITLVLEIGLIKIGADDFDKQFWVMSKVFLVRMVFLGVSTIQILHAIFTFRDYEMLNHRLLQMLVEKVRALEENAGGRALPYETESEGSLRDYSWVFDELADEVDSKTDPSYALPPERSLRRCNEVVLPEEVGENSITTSVGRRYNLRPRK